MAPLRIAFYVATLAAIVVGIATLAGHGPGQVVTGTALLAYLALLCLAVVEPRAQIFGPALTHVSNGGIALTFDDGPHPIWTRKIMDVLEAHDARGTFFMIAQKMEAHPDVVKEIVARGHAIGAHGYGHDRMYALRSLSWLERDADREEAVWEAILGRLPVLFRPPIGLTNPRIARLTSDRDRVLVAWTVRPRDGLAVTSRDTVVKRVTSRLRPGAIVLLHDAAERDDREPVALQALPAILDSVTRLGLTPAPVSISSVSPVELPSP